MYLALLFNASLFNAIERFTLISRFYEIISRTCKLKPIFIKKKRKKIEELYVDKINLLVDYKF